MIEAENLSKYYGAIRATENVSFSVNKGEIVGLLGPNGAGKSTTMKILTSYLHPSSGTARINGIDVIKNPLEARRHIGYLPEVLPLYMDMEVKEYLTFVGQARGLSGAELDKRLEWVRDNCAIKPMFRKIIRELSKGYKQRVALAQALIHDPDVIILDEPTTGLDPQQIIEIRSLIKRLAENKTIILSTHILSEIESTADRIVIINRGTVVGNGTVSQLRENAHGHDRAILGIKAQRSDVDNFLKSCNNVSHYTLNANEDTSIQCEIFTSAGKNTWRSLGEQMQNKGWKITELREAPFTLEETFLALTKAQQSSTLTKEAV